MKLRAKVPAVAISFLASALISGACLALDITVNVSGIKTDTGRLVLQVYGNKDTWLSEDTVVRQEQALAPGANTAIFHVELEPGEYAMSVYHDADDNGKLNSNFIGIPNEPVGLSNDHRPKFGPPRFSKAALTLSSDSAVEIILN